MGRWRSQLLATNPCKTPIQQLHGFGTKTGNPPVYTLIKAEGEVHNPSFTFRLVIGDIFTSFCCPLYINSLPVKNTVRDVPKQPLNQMKENPVGSLQELSVQKGWRLPEYTVAQESGPPHEREFTITCHVETFVETGMLAKRNKVIGNNLSCTWDSMRNSSGEKISMLKRSPLSIPYTDYVKMLNDLAKEQDFRLTYLDIVPITVCFFFLPLQWPDVSHHRIQLQHYAVVGKSHSNAPATKWSGYTWVYNSLLPYLCVNYLLQKLHSWGYEPALTGKP
uniref:DRBM domain-containing protein n=1 Tax=Xenopus tropicalis TaxID=8364 RepID=A0A6I8RYI9_XENTR